MIIFKMISNKLKSINKNSYKILMIKTLHQLINFKMIVNNLNFYYKIIKNVLMIKIILTRNQIKIKNENNIQCKN